MKDNYYKLITYIMLEQNAINAVRFSKTSGEKGNVFTFKNNLPITVITAN